MPLRTKKRKTNDYRQLKAKMYSRIIGTVAFSFVLIYAIYSFIWAGRGAEIIVALFQWVLKINRDHAIQLYVLYIRDNQQVIWLLGVVVIFFALLRIFINWFTHYFNFINQGIDALLDETIAEIHLPAEMSATERKLNMVKQTLKQRTLEVQLAEQRKNDLVMYLAHDIRTPLTSVIGYLSLLTEAPDMPPEQKARYTNITLDKAYRLEKMVNEFFEITRYNRQQIGLERASIDLYYMLVQLVDELSPLLADHGNTATIHAGEELKLYGDADRLARVFNNVLRNAAAYSDQDSEIIITAIEEQGTTTIQFINQGPAIPTEKLAVIFDKFYRLDEARATDTGGSGLGLAIAKEIVTLHGGTITAANADGKVIFTITLPQLSTQTQIGQSIP
ncbi:MAG: HAMP domain-containing histidine kinase [Lachnospiraceae bacterium]|nr:HAMP domain-containing histidine kinase [Lachnospiraceae bacterium]